MDGVVTLEEAVALATALPGAGPTRAEGLQISNAALAEREILRGEAPAAEARLVRLIDEFGEVSGVVASVQPLLAWAHLQQGDTAAATELLAQNLVYLRTRQLRLALVEALRVQALLAIQQHQWHDAKVILDEALALSREMPCPYAEAKALYVYGLLYHAQSESANAREHFTAALVILHRLEERLYAELIERSLDELVPD
jgi:tetratricopeptide (TPR) repeat protein